MVMNKKCYIQKGEFVTQKKKYKWGDELWKYNYGEKYLTHTDWR